MRRAAEELIPSKKRKGVFVPVIIPTRSRGGGGGGGCACACACVGCACACAGGGGFCVKLKEGLKVTAMKLSMELGYQLDFYPKKTVFPIKSRQRYGFVLTSKSTRIDLWSEINTSNFFMKIETKSQHEMNRVNEIVKGIKELSR